MPPELPRPLDPHVYGSITIEPLAERPGVADSLAAMLVDVVAAGGSVGFLHPLPRDEAAGFWRGSLAAAARGERIVFGARLGDAIVGTLTLVLALPPNQPHRAELAKMLTAPAYRGRGIATVLVRSAEAAAAACGRTMLTLDTAEDGGASSLYERLGFTRAGTLPEYALKPHGGLTGTHLYFKRIDVTS